MSLAGGGGWWFYCGSWTRIGVSRGGWWFYCGSWTRIGVSRGGWRVVVLLWFMDQDRCLSRGVEGGGFIVVHGPG